METTIKVKVQPLSADAFRPYGQVLESRHPVYPEVDGGQSSVVMLHLKQQLRQIDMLAFHFSYNQTFMPVRGAMVLIVAPPPRNREADPAAYEVDYERLAAFVLEPGQAVLIDRGTGHNAVPLGTECTAISVTKKHGEEINQVLDVVEGRTGQLRSTPVVEYLRFGKRDQRVLELEL
jgi:ureidoglycolate hydrolase